MAMILKHRKEFSLPDSIKITDDTLNGLAEDDTLQGLAGNDTLNGGINSDILIGDSGADALFGGSGFDVLIGGSEGDTLDGGADIDTASYQGSTSVQINLSNGTASGGDAEGDRLVNIENVIGSDEADTLIGDSTNNFYHRLQLNPILITKVSAPKVRSLPNFVRSIRVVG